MSILGERNKERETHCLYEQAACMSNEGHLRTPIIIGLYIRMHVLISSLSLPSLGPLGTADHSLN